MRFIVLLVIIFQFPSFAFACSLIKSERMKPADAFLNSDLVITGTLKTFRHSWIDKLAFWRDDELDSERVFEVLVTAVMKGKPRDKIYVENMQHGLCGPFLRAGDSLALIYLHSPKESSQIYPIVLIDSIENLHVHMQNWRN